MIFEKGRIPWNKGKSMPSQCGFQKGHKPFSNWKGRKHTEETKKKQRESKLENPTRYWLGKKRSKETIQKRNKTIIGKYRGEKNWNWKGGITSINERIRGSFEYKQWRETIYKKDYYTCQQCGHIGNNIVAHHIYPFSQYPEYRFEINNGITFCRNCHLHIEAIT